MSVKPVSVKLNNSTSNNNNEVKQQNNLPRNQQQRMPQQNRNAGDVAFGGIPDYVIMFMDGIERGGFVASFYGAGFLRYGRAENL